jgi:hypothetical protein
VSLTTSTLPTGVTFTPTTSDDVAVQMDADCAPGWRPQCDLYGSGTMAAPVASSSGAVAIRVTPVLRDLNFTTALVSPSGAVSRYEGRTTRQYEEELGDGVKLEMVVIQGEVTRWERRRARPGEGSNEGPSRRVERERVSS